MFIVMYNTARWESTILEMNPDVFTNAVQPVGYHHIGEESGIWLLLQSSQVGFHNSGDESRTFSLLQCSQVGFHPA